MMIENELKKIEYTVLDFETTGISAKNSRAIEIGLVKILDGKITDTYSALINPESQIPYQITLLTGITNSTVRKSPIFNEIISEVASFIGNSPIIAHNSAFDLSFLKMEFQRAEFPEPKNISLCTVKLGKRLIPQLKSHNLTSVRNHFKIRENNTHRALDDAIVTAKIFLKYLEILEEEFNILDFANLHLFEKLPIARTKIKIGKKTLLDDFMKAEEKPGIYFFKDRKGEIIYIGKAKSIKKRVASYFLPTASSKAKEIVKNSSNLDFFHTNTELTALIAEAQLIKQHNPKMNYLLKKFTEAYFVKIDNSVSFPNLKSTLKFSFDGSDYFGPYSDRFTTADILDVANKTFQLRECTESEFKRKRICYLHAIERCFAPCELDVKIQYEKEILQVHEFLSGNNQTALKILLEKMQKFSEQMKFEEAAEYRDAIQKILKQLLKTAILKEPVNKAKVLIDIQGYNGNDVILLINGKMYINDFLKFRKNSVDETLSSFYDGDSQIENNLDPEDLERIKILLNWLVNHKHLAKFYYLSDFSSKDELYTNIENW